MVALAQSHVEVELSGFTTLPNIRGVSLHNLAVHHRDTTQTEVDWCSEGPLSVGVGVSERDSVVESNVLADGTSSAESTVRNLGHGKDLLLTITLLSLGVGDSLSELLKFFSNVRFPLSGSHEDRGIL